MRPSPNPVCGYPYNDGMRIELTPVATVESSLTDPAEAPKQGEEGAPDAWLNFEEDVVAALDGLAVGDRVILLTWLDRG